MPERSDKPLSVVEASPSNTSKATHNAERRRSHRYPFTAAAEAIDLRSQTRVTGRSSDLNFGGCYIDTLNPLTVGAAVRVKIERERHQFEALATVAYSHPSMGMGLAFTQIKPQDQALLQKWMAQLGGEEPHESPMAVKEAEPEALPEILNLQQVLNELINVMVRKRVIDQNEAAALLRVLFR
jgi:hypothetical protein